MEAYSGFAEVYDRLMDDFDYPAWAAYYLTLLERQGVTAETVCDCACGTGSISLELAARGISVIASDISGDMLRVAEEKARRRGLRLRTLMCDMAALSLPKPVDAVICACDGVNYLAGEAKLSRFFKAAHAALRPGGALAFDVSSPHKLRDVLGDAFYGEVRDDVAYLWQNELRGENLRMELTFFAQAENGLYRRFDETHRQHIWDAETLVRLLERAGYENIRVYGDNSLTPPGDDEMRIHLTARRGL